MTTPSNLGRGQSAVRIVAKPLLRGWLHAVAAVAALVYTVALAWRSLPHPLLFASALIFGVSMIVLYTGSAVYHIGSWRGAVHQRLRAFDHANIFIFIAGSYTPFGVTIVSGWLRPLGLGLMWLLGLGGVAVTLLALQQMPRWVTVALYIGMGGAGIFALPALLSHLPLVAVSLLLLGGFLYILGALVYARRWPDPSPRIFGYHEIFHLFVIAACVLFALVVWVWVVPQAQG